jgi:predicted acyl esterase
MGWTDGSAPKIDLILRKGNVGFNNPEGERRFRRRAESEWPIGRTQYTPYYLTPDKILSTAPAEGASRVKLAYRALGTIDDPQYLQFASAPFAEETEITGHITAHLNVSMSPDAGGPLPRDIDLFLTLRHMDPNGQEILYTGTAGDGVPLCKGWLRLSLRKVNHGHARHRPYVPYRDYLSSDVLPVLPGEAYPVDVEIWPTNVVMEPGDTLVFEVSSGDTQGRIPFHVPSYCMVGHTEQC